MIEPTRTPEEGGSPRRSVIAAALSALALAALALIVVCRPASAPVVGPYPKPGAAITVQFRRDVLGQAATLPTSPTTGEINGAQVSIAGRFLGISEGMVGVEVGVSEYWVPRENILLLETSHLGAKP